MQLNSISQLYSIFQQNPIICTDSRKSVPNSIFFALKGDNFNANSFALSALEQGAAYAVVDEEKYAVDDKFILVANVLQTLQELAKHHRESLGTKIIGITGTNGKTTTKELIACVLKEKYNTLYTEGNLNNHIGVPLTLLKLKAEHDFGIIEMGANHQGEITQLCEIASPDYGIVTNVGEAHLEGFGSFEGVKRTKMELYQFIAKKEGAVFINSGNSALLEMAAFAGLQENEKKMIRYALAENENTAICTALLCDCSPFLNMVCNTPKGEFTLATKLIGAYNAENVLAAIAIGNYFVVSNKAIKKGLENFTPHNNRSQFIQTTKNRLIVDAYNANPSSMRAAIENFKKIEAKNKMLILGDMFELGTESKKAHCEILDLLESSDFSNVFLIGKNFKEANHSYPSFDNVDELNEHLSKNTIEDNTILIKGSRAIKMEKIIDQL